MRAKVLKTSLVVILMFFSLLYGMVSYRNHWPPYRLFERAFERLPYSMQGGSSVRQIPEIRALPEPNSKGPLDTDVEALIRIQTPADAEKLRNDLIRFLWGTPGLPTSYPATVIQGFSDSRYDDIASLERIDKLVVEMEFGLESNIYHFIPANPNNRVVLFHQGHAGDFYNSKENITRLLDDGYAVVAFSMPLLGLNNQPTVFHSRFGILTITDHDQMSFLVPEHGHPVKFFVEPVIVALNYLARDYGYSSVSMVGLSGGGWTTTLAAAMDTRISQSFPVTASYPMYLRANSNVTWGDYEQVTPDLYETVNYLEMYVLGAYGPGRIQLQILNKFDPCCFNGTVSKTYKDVVQTRVHQLGAGEFDILLDDTHREHIISYAAMGEILRGLREWGPK